MMQNVAKIGWKDYTEPAFLIIIAIPLFYSIADGLTLGFIGYAISKLRWTWSRNQLADLPAGDCARVVLRICAEPNRLAQADIFRQAQASSGSGPSDREGAAVE